MRLLRWLRRKWKRIAVAIAFLFIVANVLAARHARAFLVYSDVEDAMPQPEQLTRPQKLGLIVNGVSIPRPKNAATPPGFTTHRIELSAEWIEVWRGPAAGSPRGTVLMFPGYSAAKSTLLPEAAGFQAMGFDVVLVDFRGAGGSSGSDNTMGFREAEDVATAVGFVEARWPSRRSVLFGRSMGAAAVLRAVSNDCAKADAVILECPFDRMLTTVGNRFHAMGLPAFPGAEMLVFWVGRRLGFDGFAHNPVEYAERVRVPALMLTGEADIRATPDQVRAVFDHLPGPKHMHVFRELGHEPYRPRNARVTPPNGIGK